MILYLRSRHVLPALAAAVAAMALCWALWLTFATERQAGLQMVVLTVLVLVTIATATLAGHDDELDRTAARRWPPLRAAHLVVALAVVLALMLVTLRTGATFGPAGLVVRDAAGLIGLAGLGAATLGVARSWFLPLGWTLLAVMLPVRSERPLLEVVFWQIQEPGNRVAAVTAAVLTVTGSVAYVVGGYRMNSR